MLTSLAPCPLPKSYILQVHLIKRVILQNSNSLGRKGGRRREDLPLVVKASIL
jgi:hypothetical protein